MKANQEFKKFFNEFFNKKALKATDVEKSFHAICDYYGDGFNLYGKGSKIEFLQMSQNEYDNIIFIKPSGPQKEFLNAYMSFVKKHGQFKTLVKINARMNEQEGAA